MWLLIAALSAHAGGLVGLDWVPPLGRGDLAWIEADQLSGTLVTESDGLIVGPLRAWGGWTDGANAVLAGLSGARFATVSVGQGVSASTSVGALRPSLDYRRSLRARQVGAAQPYVQAGLHLVIPGARTWSNAFSDTEQAAYDAEADATRARIGAWGMQGGAGVDVPLNAALSIGARYFAVMSQQREKSDTVNRTSTVFGGEAAVVLGFAL